MIIFNLANNNFYGSIPNSFGSFIYLHMLLISNNNLSEKIPDSLINCQFLTILDLGSNQLRGRIPSWIGTDMPILEALMLGRNSFDGNIPTTLCQLKSLKILDLAENQLRGEIPKCVFLAMATEEGVNEKSYMELLTIKESYLIYQSEIGRLKGFKAFDTWISKGGVRFLKMIDLSSNFLTQGIPVEIAKLVELISLNLSRNQLVGSIPSNISELKYLEALDLSRNQLVGSIPSKIGELVNLELLDLSRNQLSCAIPTSILNLHLLGILNLSYNTLSRDIPQGAQFSTFTKDSYEGNRHLCGPPLRKACPRNKSIEDAHFNHSKEHENDSNHEDKGMDREINPFYISMAAGFSTGFWVFWGSLISTKIGIHLLFLNFSIFLVNDPRNIKTSIINFSNETRIINLSFFLVLLESSSQN